MTEGFKFPFSFSAKEKGRKRKLPADVRKRKNSLRESGEKNSPGAPVTGRSHTQLIRAKKLSRAAQTAFPLGRLSSSFFCIAFSHRPDFKSFSAACTLTPLTRDECPSVSPLYHFVTQRRSVDTSNSPAAFSVNVKAVHLNSSSIFCFAKHRGFLFVHSSQQREERTKKRRRCYRAYSLGRYCRRRGLRNSLRSDSPRPGSSVGRRPPGPIKAVFPAGHACCYFPQPLSSGRVSLGFSPISLRDTEEKCE